MKPEIHLGLGPLHTMVGEYLKLLKQARSIDVETKEGGREPMLPEDRKKLEDALDEATHALTEGCQQTVYGLHLILEK